MVSSKLLFSPPCPSLSNSDFDDRNVAVELSFVESEAQAQRVGKRGRERVEVGQAARCSHLGEGDGARAVVHSDGDPVAGHLVGQTSLPAVVPGSQLPVMLLRQAPRYLEIYHRSFNRGTCLFWLKVEMKKNELITCRLGEN